MTARRLYPLQVTKGINNMHIQDTCTGKDTHTGAVVSRKSLENNKLWYSSTLTLHSHVKSHMFSPAFCMELLNIS